MEQERQALSINATSEVNGAGKLVFRVSVKEGDVLKEKTLNVKDFIKLLDMSLEEGDFVEIPKLPPEIVSAKQDIANPSSYDVVIVYPAAIRPFAIAGEHMMLPFPALCCTAKVRDGKRRDTRMFSLPCDNPTKDTPVTKYPFGNGGSEEGNCCFGNIVIDDIADIRNACNILDAFIFGRTNGDLYNGNVKGYTSQGEFVSYLRELDSFPTELLVTTGKVFGDLL